MPPANEKKLRFSQALLASGWTPAALRLALQRGLLNLFSDPSDGWREFSFFDIVALALTRHMVDCNVPIETASNFANAAVRRCAGMLLGYKNTPPQALVAGLSGYAMVVWGGPAWRFGVYNTKGEPSPEAAEGLAAEAFIFIDMHKTAERAIAAAVESLGE